MKERNVNIDILRVIAIVFVIFVHFLLNIGFYNAPIISKRMIFLNNLRIILMTCVPLFLIITGFLMNEKTLNKKYYKGIIRVVSLYLIISFLCFLFSKYYLKMPNYNLSKMFFGMFDFSNNPYSWYVKMYIGLFFMIPVFNIIINNVDKKKFQIILVTMILLTIAPTFANIFNLTSLSQFVNTNVNSYFNTILNDYWLALWPITYYFTGAYLKKYPIKMELSKTICLILTFWLMFSIFNINRNYGFVFSECLYVQYFGFQTYILSVLISIAVLNIKFEPKSHKLLNKIILFVSNYSFGMYLSSWILDTIIYNKLNSIISDINLKIPYILFVPILIICGSLFISWISSIIFKTIIKYALITKQIFTKLFQSLVRIFKNLVNYKYIHLIILSAVLVAYGILAINKAKYGTGSSDEAFYLTIPFRMNLGDVLIINEWHLSQLASFIVFPIMKIYSLFNINEAIILNFRVIFIIFKLVTSIIVFKNLQKHNKFMAIISVFLYLLYTPYNITQFSYNSLGLIFITLFVTTLYGESNLNIKYLSSGIFLALSVLCCPFFAVYIIFIFVKIFLLLAKKDYENIKNHLLVIVGGFLVLALFILYLLFNTNTNNIIETLPYLFKDPEHANSNVFTTILLLLKTIINYFSIVSYCFIGLMIISLFDYILNKKVMLKNLYMFCLSISTIFQLLILNTNIVINYNFIMLPLSLNVMFILFLSLLEEKRVNKFTHIAVSSLLYGLCLITSSNQLLYAFSTAISIIVFISPIVMYNYIKSNISINKERALMIVIFSCLILIQLTVQFNSVNTHVFPMYNKSQLNHKITKGPLKGIYTSYDELVSYELINNDLEKLKKLPRQNFLCYNCLPYAYLYVGFPMATQSGWSANIDYQIEIEKDYQLLNRDKEPHYIYIKKQDIDKFNKDYLYKYDREELDDGYVFIKKEKEKK